MTREGRRAALLLALGAAGTLLVWLSSGETERDAAPVVRTGPASEVTPARLPLAQAEASMPDAPAAAQPAPLLQDGPPRPIDPLATPRVAGCVLRRGDDAPLDDVEVLVIVDDPVLGEPAIVADLRTAGGSFALPPEVVARGPHTLQFVWHAWGPDPPVDTDDGPVRLRQVVLHGDRDRTAVAVLRLDQVAGPLDALAVWLDTGWIARGRIVDNTGQPVSGVEVFDRVERWRPFRLPAVSGADGRFALGDLDPAAPLRLLLHHMRQDVPGSARDVPPPEEAEVLDLGDLVLPYAAPPRLR